MARIISDGDSLLSAEIQITCGRCGTVFGVIDAREIYAEEVRETHEEGEHEPVLRVHCPKCELPIRIDVQAAINVALKKKSYFMWQ